MTTMTFALGDDWEGIYVDGTLITEGHSINPVEAVRLAIEHRASAVETKLCDLGWLHDEGNLPNAMADVKWES